MYEKFCEMSILLLILFQLIWSGTYTAMILAMQEMPPGLILILRYGIAVLVLALMGHLHFKNRFTRKEWTLIFLVGFLNFSLSPYCQLKALTLTHATDAAVLVAFEPLIVAFLAVLLLREKLRRSTIVTFMIATAGVLMMSGASGFNSKLDWMRLIGNGFFMVSLVFEGIYSILAKQLVRKYHPMSIMAWLMFAGFLGNFAGNFHLLTPHHLEKITSQGIWALLYLALLASAVCYTGWTYLLKKIPVNQIALSGFLQPVTGSLIAAFMLGETFAWQTYVGSMVVVSSLSVWLWQRLRARQFLPAPTQRTA